MNVTNMQHIPLASSYLCPDCNCIGNCAEQCPACASPVLLALANVLDRKAERDSAVTYNYTYKPARQARVSADRETESWSEPAFQRLRL